MSKTGQATALSSSSATLSITRVSVMRLKRGGRDGIAEDILRPGHHCGGRHRHIARDQAKIAALARAKHQSVRPEAHRLTVAIGCLVTDPERDQRQTPDAEHRKFTRNPDRAL